MALVIEELDQRQNEVLGLVEASQNLVLGDRDRGGAGDAAFYLDEPQTPRAGPALDVVAQMLELTIGGIEAELRSMSMTIARARAAAAIVST